MKFYTVESDTLSRGNKIRYVVVNENGDVVADANGTGFITREKAMNHFVKYVLGKKGYNKKFKQKS